MNGVNIGLISGKEPERTPQYSSLEQLEKVRFSICVDDFRQSEDFFGIPMVVGPGTVSIPHAGRTEKAKGESPRRALITTVRKDSVVIFGNC